MEAADLVIPDWPGLPENIGALATDWKKAERSNRWALVWVDEQTKSVWGRTQIETPSGCIHVSTSCWTSFKNG